MDKKEKECKEIIEKLKENLYNYEIFFDNSEEAFFIHIDGIPIVMNNAALKLIGIKKEELGDFSLYKFTAEEDLEMVKDKIKSGFEGVYEFKIKRKNGEKIPCRFYVKQILYRNKAARVVFVRDISEEKKKLKEQEKQIRDIEKFRRVLVSIAKAISKIEISYERIIETIIEMAHLSLDSCCCGFWALEDNNKYLSPVILIAEDLNKENYRIDMNNLNKNLLENRITVIEDAEQRKNILPKSKCKEKIMLIAPVIFENNFIGIIIFFRNSHWIQYEQDFIASVADMVVLAFEKWNRKWAEAELQTTLKELEKSNRIKSDFISLISHELRTPLTSIIGYSTFLLKGISGQLNQSQKEFAEAIKHNSDRLLKIVNELLDISRIEKGKISLDKQKNDIIEIIDKVISDMEPIINAKKIKIRKSFEAKKIEINCDRGKIMQVITNLIDNAMKYSRKDIEIEIRVEIVKDFKKYQKIYNFLKDMKYILISVKDNGIGIEKENLKKIFDMFTQLEKIEVRKHSGVGLGLYIGQQIIKQHGGVIWAESEGKDKGSTFNILLPVN